MRPSISLPGLMVSFLLTTQAAGVDVTEAQAVSLFNGLANTATGLITPAKDLNPLNCVPTTFLYTNPFDVRQNNMSTLPPCH